jgi:hypothetical protein
MAETPATAPIRLGGVETGYVSQLLHNCHSFAHYNTS